MTTHSVSRLGLLRGWRTGPRLGTIALALPPTAAGRVSHRRQEDAVVEELDRIGFIVHHPEMFHHYQNVWRHMPAGSVEVVVAAKPPLFESIVQGCARYEVPWRDAAELIRNKQRYVTALSAFPAINSDLAATRSIARYSLRFMYASGKAGWNFRP